MFSNCPRCGDPITGPDHVCIGFLPGAAAEPAPVASLAVARFDRDMDPKSHSPRAALEKALADLDGRDAEHRVEHVIVLFGRTTVANSSATGFFQAGSYAHHSQIGLLEEGKMMLRESGERSDGR